MLEFVVQDIESGLFLCPEGGDVGYTQRLKYAGTFFSHEEALQAGIDHFAGHVDVIAILPTGGRVLI
ncbi:MULTISPECIES: hypothetical protein [Burkholderia]|uniref:hypothetical protein n=1 Tax=Burkholderia TaxID=32008 RepID=UPI00384B2BFE